MFFIMSFLVKYPLRRDLATLKYFGYDSKLDNYLDVQAGKIVLNYYKTVKFFGRKEFDIPRDTWKAVSWMMKQHRLRGLTDGHLLKNSHWKPLSSGSFTSYMVNKSKVCFPCCKNKRMGCALLRHLVVSYKNRNAPTLEEKEKLASEMMHSPEEADLYRINGKFKSD